MFFCILLFLMFMCAVFMPHTWRVLELLLLAPIVGVAFGGFAWSVAAMFVAL